MLTGATQAAGVEIAAGRLLERIWIMLNAQGVAVHPYYALSDQLYRSRAGLVQARFVPRVGSITQRVADVLGSPEQTIFMLLRVGIPKVVNPTRSRRLPERVTFEFSHTP
jgi:hypothetical protein